MSHRPLQRTTLEGNDIVYNYATVAVNHLGELQAFIDDLMKQDQLSTHETFRDYVVSSHYALPDEMAEASSIVIIALYTPLAKAKFSFRGKQADLLIPPQYYGLGLPKDVLSTIVSQEILSARGSQLERLTHGHLKLLAVRSGLAQYGRNNITYVNQMGTFITLAAFVTNETLPDEWTDLSVMPQCASCTICLDSCPTGAIRHDAFVIDAGRCLTLYNEISGDFPEWISDEFHNAAIGCMHCQLPCPANQCVIDDFTRLPDLTEDETAAILAGDSAAPAIASAAEKLRMGLADEDTLRIVSRNIRALLDPDSLHTSKN